MIIKNGYHDKRRVYKTSIWLEQDFEAKVKGLNKECAISNDPYKVGDIITDHIGSIIIKKNTSIPCNETSTYYTIYEGQDSIKITVTQGESEDPDYVEIIHEAEMQLPPNRPENRPVEFTYGYDDNQRMHCVFKDVESNKTLDVELTRSGDRFDASTIERSKASVEDFIIE